MKPLDGIKVLDLTQFRSGPVCTSILYDMGADVIKFENAATGGEINRTNMPVDGVSAEYTSTSRGKKSVLVDFKNDKVRELFLKLAETADIVVENYRPGTMEKLGIGYEILKSRNPKIILTSISGYGQDGPWAKRGAYDTSVQAVSGLMSVTGDFGGNPLKCGFSISDNSAGLWAAIGTLAALAGRDRNGAGTHIDISMLETSLFMLDQHVASYFVSGQLPPRLGNRHQTSCPMEPYTCKDGERVLVVAPQQRQFINLCQGLGHPELPEDERFNGHEARHNNRFELEKELGKIIGEEWNSENLCDMLEERGLSFSKINNIEQALNLEQTQYRHALADVHWPDKENIYHCLTSPVHMSGMERTTDYKIAAAGADTFDVFGPYENADTLHEIFDSYIEAVPEIFAKLV